MKLHLPSCRPKLPSIRSLPRTRTRTRSFSVSMSTNRRRENLVVIMGATGAGKSRLSIDLATRFPSEIINSDKIQLCRGLEITTNKIPIPDRKSVPHHLLGVFDSDSPDVTPELFRLHASSSISHIHSRRRLPLLVGGSNSLLSALLSDHHHRYRTCFLWVDVSSPVLDDYLLKRVDEMLDSGMLDELAEFYASGIGAWRPNSGLRKAIGVPEFERYFEMFPPNTTSSDTENDDDGLRVVLYEEAVRTIKDNTCQLAKRQIEKIVRLREDAGWDLHRLDATDAFRGSLEGSDTWHSVWERKVVDPSVKIVKRFLEEMEME